MFQKIYDKLQGKYSLRLIEFVYNQMFKSAIGVFKIGASSVYLKYLGTFYMSSKELIRRIEMLKRLEMSHEKEDNWLKISQDYKYNDRDN